MINLLDYVNLKLKGQRVTWENAFKNDLMTVIYRDLDRK